MASYLSVDEKLTPLQKQCMGDLENIVRFIQPYLPLANLHNTNFLTHHTWQMIPQNYQTELLNRQEKKFSELQYKSCHAERLMFDEVLREVMPEMVKGVLQTSKPLQIEWQHSDLTSFLSTAKRFRLSELKFVQMCEEEIKTISMLPETTTPFINNSMNLKKSHEVKEMSAWCARVAHQHQINHVVDIGSGKGYLSSSLALQYKLKVIGVDAVDGNTIGATQRLSRLSKHWNGLVRRELETTSEELNNSQEVTAASDKRNKKKLARERRLAQLREKSDIDLYPTTHSEYTPVTAHVNAEMNMAELTSQHFGDEKILVTGLHTCGNLASSILQLYVSSDIARAMVNVGCCYHLLDEKFSRNPYLCKGDADPPSHFPMSDFLTALEFSLGRNARMLSMQCVEKVEGQSLNKAIFWRALLQQMLCDEFGYWTKEWEVGKVAAKSENFYDYVSKCSAKLQVRQFNKDEISQYMEKYGMMEKQMAAFYQLRCALAPAIESIILLDRCLYLSERRETDLVLLSKLFDSTISPRCYAIFATK